MFVCVCGKVDVLPPEDVGIDRAEIVWKIELITLDYMEHHSHGSAVRWTARIVAGVTFLHRRNYQTPNLLSDCDRRGKVVVRLFIQRTSSSTGRE